MEFPEPCLQIVETLREATTEELLADPKRKDLRALNTLTIDGAFTRDFDDAVHIVKKENGQVEVGIHITDVSYYVPVKSPLFAEARERSTSLYFPEGHIPMLPKTLSLDLCSLIQGKIRPTISFLVTLTAEGTIAQTAIVPAIIEVKRQLSYREADGLIDRDPDLAALNVVRQQLRQQRVDQGALLLSDAGRQHRYPRPRAYPGLSLTGGYARPQSDIRADDPGQWSCRRLYGRPGKHPACSVRSRRRANESSPVSRTACPTSPISGVFLPEVS